MSGFTLNKHIHASPETVFSHFTDFAKAAETIEAITEMEILTEGPVKKGTRFRETRVMFKREATEEMEVIAFDPPRSYALGCESHGCRYHTEYRFKPSGTGTDVEMDFHAEPLTFVSKMMSVLTKPMMKMVLKDCSKDLDDLKIRIEQASGSS